MKEDEMLPTDCDSVYAEIASLFKFDVLGMVAGDKPDQPFAEFREDVGTLPDERWKQLKWTTPKSESSVCWWLVNGNDPDKTQPPKLLSRSLACLRLELGQQRITTSGKINYPSVTLTRKLIERLHVFFG